MEKNRTINIIGWGIAGATLSWHLLRKGYRFRVYDSGENHSSRVAAGLVNPIVFKRLTKSWQADTLLPYAKDFYSGIEGLAGQKLMSNRSIARVFASVEEQNNWSSLLGDDRFDHYLSPISDLEETNIQSPHGIGKVKTIGNLDVNLFLDLSKSYLIEQEVEFEDRSFVSEMIDLDQEYVYCDGYQLTQNPFFNYIPMRPTHGDVITIQTDQLQIEDIVNKNMFVLPLGNGFYRVGATYNWKKREPEPTRSGLEELLERLKSFTNFDFKVVKHDAGIRPTVSDRRPLLGTHPVNRNLHVFNGLGTKGVMIGPYYAHQMSEYLCEGTDIDKEVDIKRFEKHFNA
jgi:glycine oxidase